jgi:hypothetical protein
MKEFDVASILNQNLALIVDAANSVKVRVEYDAVLTELERNLAGLGIVYREHIHAFGDDPSNDDNLALAPNSVIFPDQNLPVTAGSGALTLHRTREIRVDRKQLQEDTFLGDDDEIFCQITLTPVGAPTPVARNTPVRVLGN